MKRIFNNQKLNKVMNDFIIVIGHFFFIIGIASSIAFLIGYRQFLIEGATVDWNFVDSLTNMIVPFVIAFLTYFLTLRITKSENVISEANIIQSTKIRDLEKYIDIKIEEGMDGVLVIEGQEQEDDEETILKKLKDRAHYFVSMGLHVKTNQVAEFLEITSEEAYKILFELVRVDHSITCAGQLSKDNLQNVIWMPKR